MPSSSSFSGPQSSGPIFRPSVFSLEFHHATVDAMDARGTDHSGCGGGGMDPVISKGFQMVGWLVALRRCIFYLFINSMRLIAIMNFIWQLFKTLHFD